jgi:hypothetical protein
MKQLFVFHLLIGIVKSFRIIDCWNLNLEKVTFRIMPIEKRYILPPQYQSRNIGFDEWFQLLTLGLAPFVLHLATGVPEPTVLGADEPPGWWDRLPLFNPISILWRYFAVADRRIRAKYWDKRDVAASNAAFWDARTMRWDGSDELLVPSRTWITREPTSSHVSLLSASALSTLGLTMQSIQVIVSLAKEYSSSHEALSMVFSSFASFSLFRLVAACWLSNDYGFTTGPKLRNESLPVARSQWRLVGSMNKLDAYSALVEGTLAVAGEPIPGSRLHATISWRGRVSRITMGILLLASFGYGLWSIGWGILWRQEDAVTATEALVRIFYGFIAVGTLSIFGYYLVLGQNRSTILPCIQEPWYKWYTHRAFDGLGCRSCCDFGIGDPFLPGHAAEYLQDVSLLEHRTLLDYWLCNRTANRDEKAPARCTRSRAASTKGWIGAECYCSVS